VDANARGAQVALTPDITSAAAMSVIDRRQGIACGIIFRFAIAQQ